MAAAWLLVGMQTVPAGAAQAPGFSALELRGGVGAPNRPARRAALPLTVPLPRPRPADAPAAGSETPVEEGQTPDGTDKPVEEAVPTAPQPSACRRSLTDDVAIAPSIPDIHGTGGCGGVDLVRLEAVMLPDRRRVPVKPPAILRCTMASAIANWIRADIAPLTTGLGSVISELDNFDSFECRGRNRVPGAKLSEHGRANALDIRAFKLANGQLVSLTDRTVSREIRESVLHSMCARFLTVLGPGSDWYHEDHIHIDLMERNATYRICQWNVWDPLPQVAPLLPAERPEEAPPRDVAATSDEPPPDASAAEPDAGTTKPAIEKPPAKKKRRHDRRF